MYSLSSLCRQWYVTIQKPNALRSRVGHLGEEPGSTLSDWASAGSLALCRVYEPLAKSHTPADLGCSSARGTVSGHNTDFSPLPWVNPNPWNTGFPGKQTMKPYFKYVAKSFQRACLAVCSNTLNLHILCPYSKR